MQDLDRSLIYKHTRAQMEMTTQGQPAASRPRWRPQGLLMLLILLLLCVRKGSVPESGWLRIQISLLPALNSTPREAECKKLPSSV